MTDNNSHLTALREWQDISTAPKDGRQILSYEGGRQQVVRWHSFGGNDKGNWRIAYDDYFPTHWQPLPAQPTATTTNPVSDKGE